MKIYYNDLLKKDLLDYLLMIDGINDVKINRSKGLDCINIDSNLSSNIIASYIDSFQEYKTSNMFAFDKEENKNTKELIYNVDDMCCEYCHMNFIRDLFNNDNIIAVTSNFDLNKTAINIIYKIKYADNCEEKEIIKFIKTVNK